MNPRTITIDSTPVKVCLECQRPGQCLGGFRLGLLFATYLHPFKGRVRWRLTVGSEAREGEWREIADNSEAFIDYDGRGCSGQAMLEIVKDSGGSLALWSKGDAGLPAFKGGVPMGKVCHSLVCLKESQVPVCVKVQMPSFAGMVRTMNVHGGVRRYFELGNALVAAGHSYSLYAVPVQEKVPWMPFAGKCFPYEQYKDSEHDVAFTGAYESFPHLLAARAKVKVVFVVAKFYADKYLELWRKHGKGLRWIGVAAGWNKGMEEIEGTCVPGGVNTSFFTSVRRVEGRRLRVAFYARTGDGRGVERIIGLAKKLAGKVDFVGFDAPGYPTTTGCRIPNVSVHETPTQESLRSLLRSCDVVVSCMRSAGWNNVVAEGAACGCVPVCNDAGTMDVVLHGRTGYLCRTQHFESDAAECLVHLDGHRGELSRMSDTASRWVKQFDWAVVAQKIVAEVGR